MDEQNMINYVTTQLHNPDLALKLALRCDLPGAEELVVRKFNMLYSNGQFADAARLFLLETEG